ncbi:MAG TPA: NAD(P)-binding domain-containing protein [Tepidisphaeraceae bacterium]|jgi:thioredoxin reductase (NADPH)|nr:NAD(P)-binding domain-containing protein [Tepidisphaeraceae bacterium]
METLKTEVAVVGAGPIGLELAVALKRAKIDYQHFDARQIGYTVSWFAPGTRFFSSNERIAIAGVPLQTPEQGKATREDYLAYLRGVVQQFDLKVNTYEPIVGIERQEAEFVVKTRPGGAERVCRAKSVVLATGGTDHPRRLNIPGEDLPHVSHYFRDPHLYFRRRLLIVGGKNSAVEAALRCHHAGASVALSYRQRELGSTIKYWLLPEMNELLRSGRIAGHFHTAPTRITPAEVTLKSVAPGMLTDGQVAKAIAFDFVLLLIGYEQDNALLKLAGVEILGDCGSPRFDEGTMETNVPGLYVAGTAVAGTQDKYKVFIENCHVHVDRIVAALTGAAAPAPPKPVALPES